MDQADLQPDINKEQLDKFVQDYNFVAWFPVSAQENTGIGMKGVTRMKH